MSSVIALSFHSVRSLSVGRPIRRAITGQLVVAVGVAEVARADLRAHVPAVERSRGVADAADLQVHVADHRHRVPAQAQLGEPAAAPGCRNGTSSTASAGSSCQVTGAPGVLDQQRQEVEPAALAGRPGQPSLASQAGHLDAGGIPDHSAAGQRVARVPDQLRAEDPRPRAAGRVGREHRDQRPDPAAVGGRAQVSDRLGGDVRRRGDRAPGRGPAGCASTAARCTASCCATRPGRRTSALPAYASRCRSRRSAAGPARSRRYGGSAPSFSRWNWVMNRSASATRPASADIRDPSVMLRRERNRRHPRFRATRPPLPTSAFCAQRRTILTFSRSSLTIRTSRLRFNCVLHVDVRN